MAVRKIVKIDEEKCDGCGQCIVDCAEAALEIVDGKARMVKESFCDGLGACLGSCPVDAITIEQREADGFDEEAVEQRIAELKEAEKTATQAAQSPGLAQLACGCPGSSVRTLDPSPVADDPTSCQRPSQLGQWPLQLTLVPPTAPFLREADVLLVADCVPFAMADFHERFLRGRPIVIGCPKLDDAQSYVDKLSAMIEQAPLRSLTILHMEVPCCSGLCGITQAALEGVASAARIPIKEVTISTDGRVISERDWP